MQSGSSIHSLQNQLQSQMNCNQRNISNLKTKISNQTIASSNVELRAQKRYSSNVNNSQIERGIFGQEVQQRMDHKSDHNMQNNWSNHANKPASSGVYPSVVNRNKNQHPSDESVHLKDIRHF